MLQIKCGKLLGSLLLCCVILGGCAKESSNSALAENFLEQVYTANLNQRYADFGNADIEDKAALDAATSEYYEEFEALVTEGCLENMMANRIPLSYDKAASEKNAVVSVEKISLEELTGDGYEYTVTLKTTVDGVDEETTCTGQLQFETVGEETRISAFSCQ